MKKIILLCGLGCFICFVSCKKNEVEEVTNDDFKKFLQDEALVNNFMDDIDNETEDAEFSQSSSSKKSFSFNDTTQLSGRTINISLNGTTRIITVTYKNFDHPRGLKKRILNGKVKITITGARIFKTYKRVVEFENFTIDSAKIEGIKTVEQIDSVKYKISLTNGKTSFADGKSISHSFTKIRTMVEGLSTPYYIWDDAYTFSGSAEGVNRKGFSYTKTITKPVKIYTKFWCPVEGSFDLEVKNKKISLDYGNGAFDTKATITINGISYEITIR